jgi:hypothetical protein
MVVVMDDIVEKAEDDHEQDVEKPDRPGARGRWLRHGPVKIAPGRRGWRRPLREFIRFMRFFKVYAAGHF